MEADQPEKVVASRLDLAATRLQGVEVKATQSVTGANKPVYRNAKFPDEVDPLD